jgi:hypothetical protein
MRRCVYRKQLDLETLVATRGPNFPLGRLEARLMCPACGNRRVTVVFEPPSNAMLRFNDIRDLFFFIPVFSRSTLLVAQVIAYFPLKV